jgi:hypothetical protein
MKTRRTLLGALSLAALLLIQAMPAHAVGGGHCVFRLIPIGRGVAPHAIATRPELVGCYATYAEAILAGTGGAIRLPTGTSPRSVTDEMLAAAAPPGVAMATVVIGTEYDLLNYGGSSKSYTASSTCTASTTWETSYVGNAWNDLLSSGRGFGGCHTNRKFVGSSFTGASVTCTPNCSGYGAVSNLVSSLRWRV